MKIGTITLHYQMNYGGLLQAYALQRVLQRLGHDSEIIDYRAPLLYLKPRLFSGTTLKRSVKFWLGRSLPRPIVDSRIRWKKSIEFVENHLPLSSSPILDDETLRNRPGDYDAYITGSDQVWNPAWYGDEAPAYRLSFVPSEKRRISYAASFGVDRFSEAQTQVFKPDLEKFDCISVREDNGVAIVRDICGKDANVVLDPTLLMDSHDWQDLFDRDIQDNNYILCYFIGQFHSVLPFLESMSERMNLPLVKVGRNYADSRVRRKMEIKPHAGPLEFLRLLAGCSWLVTNSFHGVALSVVLKKRFSVIANTSARRAAMSARIESILSKLQLNEAAVQLGESFVAPQCCYEQTHDYLAPLRGASIDFLEEALG